MNLENINDEIYAFLETQKAPIPEIGWIQIGNIMNGNQDADFTKINDPRFEILYGRGRLILDKEWPEEIVEGAMYKIVTALYKMRCEGTTVATLSQIAQHTKLVESTITQNLAKKEHRHFVAKAGAKCYKLLLTPSSPIYVRRPYKIGRLSTLTEELLLIEESDANRLQSTQSIERFFLSASEERLKIIESEIAHQTTMIEKLSNTLTELKAQKEKLILCIDIFEEKQ